MSTRPAARFKAGDRVAVTRDCLMTEHVGRAFTVRRVRWQEPAGKSPGGWVVETDEAMRTDQARPMWRTFWEKLLEPAGEQS